MNDKVSAQPKSGSASTRLSRQTVVGTESVIGNLGPAGSPRPHRPPRERDGRSSTERPGRPKSKPSARTYHLFINPAAAGFKRRTAEGLFRQLRSGEPRVEMHEAASGAGLLIEARRVAESTGSEKKAHTVFVAVGGDGTVNLVARAALESDIPLGIIPFGRVNNIARSLCGNINPDESIKRLSLGWTAVDSLRVGDQLVLSAAGLGLLPSLQGYLLKKGAPRFGIGWGMLSSDLYKKQAQLSLTLKLDAHRLTVTTKILSIHLLPFAAGLNLSPMSQRADTHFEVILDRGTKPERGASYIRDAAAKQLHFGAGLTAYRCAKLTIQPVRQQPFYLDGETVLLPSDVLEISHSPKQLQVIGVV